MRTWPLPAAAVLLLVLSPPVKAVDYAKIDRTLTKEPVYQSKTPKYAMLLFGPEAKLRVWVVLDGETVYLDRNGDGDLTAKDERFENQAACKDIEIVDPDGKTRYVITSMSDYKHGDPPRPQLIVRVDIKGPVKYQQYCDVRPEESPKKAGIAHFHGPLTMGPRTIWWKVPPKLALKVGDQPVDLPAFAGTMNAEYGCWVVVSSHNGDKSAFPKGVAPVVEVEFPAKTPGAPAVKKRYALDQFC